MPESDESPNRLAEWADDWNMAMAKDDKTYKSMEIASYIVRKANKRGVSDLTPLKLIKLIYISHGCYLGKNKIPLIYEDVEAWQYGPVIPEVHASTRQFHREHIHEIPGGYDDDVNDDANKIIADVISVYGKYSGSKLIKMTHVKKSPWYKATDGGRMYGRGLVIPQAYIQEYYERAYK